MPVGQARAKSEAVLTWCSNGNYFSAVSGAALVLGPRSLCAVSKFQAVLEKRLSFPLRP